MAVTIRDFNFIATDNETLNQTFLELQNTLNDIKAALISIDSRLSELEEE